ncbi:hypothetical protein MF672_020180 [Actinomadura sp. ATCC 31491]|uniref:Uncharacterized protein n=1 Tax=Actinomadura luzonensis TaxID=2805427 RepID=A0ABT0FUT4_9ACTN|nr:hypothetical protein [Actinomadura luzonensis]MCK2216099.1 hypothetical protein [Actinomadura luzonensis]
MAEDVRRFIEALITKYGVWRVATGPFLLVPILAALGLVAGGSTVSVIAASLTLLISVILVVALAQQLRTERRRRAERDKVITRLVGILAASDKPAPYAYRTWDEHVVVSRHGDTVIDQWKEVVVEQGQELSILWAGTEQSAGRPTETERRKIEVFACNFTDTPQGRRDGADYDLVEVWQENALVIYLPLDQPIQEGRRLKIHITWVWPGFYRHLVEGGRDDVFWLSKRAKLQNLTFSMTFGPSCGLDRELRIRPFPGCPAPRQQLRADRSLVIDGAYGPKGVPPRAGFTLDNSVR